MAYSPLLKKRKPITENKAFVSVYYNNSINMFINQIFLMINASDFRLNSITQSFFQIFTQSKGPQPLRIYSKNNEFDMQCQWSGKDIGYDL